MTQELYQKALKFAGEKHSSQQVPGTAANYLLHISNVAMEVMVAHANAATFDLNWALQVAILHDTLEDTDTTFDELASNFDESIAIAVQALTKDSAIESKEQKMIDSLARINRLQKEVGIVKLADRITNLQKPPNHWTPDKIRKYHEEARLIAQTLSNKNEYLHRRLLSKMDDYLSYTGH